MVKWVCVLSLLTIAECQTVDISRRDIFRYSNYQEIVELFEGVRLLVERYALPKGSLEEPSDESVDKKLLAYALSTTVDKMAIRLFGVKDPENRDRKKIREEIVKRFGRENRVPDLSQLLEIFAHPLFLRSATGSHPVQSEPVSNQFKLSEEEVVGSMHLTTVTSGAYSETVKSQRSGSLLPDFGEIRYSNCNPDGKGCAEDLKDCDGEERAYRSKLSKHMKICILKRYPGDWTPILEAWKPAIYIQVDTTFESLSYSPTAMNKNLENIDTLEYLDRKDLLQKDREAQNAGFPPGAFIADLPMHEMVHRLLLGNKLNRLPPFSLDRVTIIAVVGEASEASFNGFKEYFVGSFCDVPDIKKFGKPKRYRRKEEWTPISLPPPETEKAKEAEEAKPLNSYEKVQRWLFGKKEETVAKNVEGTKIAMDAATTEQNAYRGEKKWKSLSLPPPETERTKPPNKKPVATKATGKKKVSPVKGRGPTSQSGYLDSSHDSKSQARDVSSIARSEGSESFYSADQGDADPAVAAGRKQVKPKAKRKKVRKTKGKRRRNILAPRKMANRL